MSRHHGLSNRHAGWSVIAYSPLGKQNYYGETAASVSGTGLDGNQMQAYAGDETHVSMSVMPSFLRKKVSEGKGKKQD